MNSSGPALVVRRLWLLIMNAMGSGFPEEGDRHEPAAKRPDRHVERGADAEMLVAEAGQGRRDAAAEDLADTDHKPGGG